MAFSRPQQGMKIGWASPVEGVTSLGFRTRDRVCILPGRRVFSGEPFQGSRWRLRRTRQIWILNGVLVLRYRFLRKIPTSRAQRLAQHEMILHLDALSKQGTAIMDVHPTLYTREASAAPAAYLCAGHAQQLGGESPLPNLMEVKD
jgi:hypothetical protein